MKLHPCHAFMMLFLALSLSGCGSDGAEDPVTVRESPDGPELTRLQLQLNWFPESQHGGYYAALLNGYYEEAGIDLEILPGGPNVPVIQSVATDRIPLAIANADQVLLGRAQGAETVALFAAMQNSPRCIMVHRDSGIKTFEQLTDITLALGSGKPFVAYLKSKVPLKDVTIVPYTGSVALFLRDKNFAQQAYVSSEPYVAELQGAKVRTLMVSDLGYNPYTSVLITSDEMLEKQQELIDRVIHASQRGWQAYLKDPAATNRHIHKLNPELELAALEYAMKAIRPLCLPEGVAADNFGHMDQQRWTTLSEQLAELKLIEAGAVDPSKAFYQPGAVD